MEGAPVLWAGGAAREISPEPNTLNQTLVATPCGQSAGLSGTGYEIFRGQEGCYRGTSRIRKCTPPGPYRRVLRLPRGVGIFLWARYPCNQTVGAVFWV